jgi:hypothetical protein
MEGGAHGDLNAPAIAARDGAGVTGGPRAPEGRSDPGAEAIVRDASEPPSDPVRAPPRPGEPPQGENRDFANIVALLFVVALAIGAFWLFKELQRHNDILNCVASGRRNCDDLGRPDAGAP